LRKTKARVKFLSLEPLIGPLPKLNLKKIDWVIGGGESGFKPRPMDPDWVLDIQEQCDNADVAFFFKQWGGKNKKAAGRILNVVAHLRKPNEKKNSDNIYCSLDFDFL
jgi:protein gp37